MLVKQIYGFVNDAVSQAVGEQATLLTEDLSNVVDVGTALFNANAVDNYVRELVDRIGRVIFVDRKYRGSAPSVYMDSWEYGSVCEKISGDLYDAEENETWALVDGATYDQQQFYAPKVSVKFFNKKTTFEIPISITKRQVKESFTSATELDRFVSMIYNDIEKSLTVQTDELITRTVNNAVAETVYNEFDANSIAHGSASGVRAINVLYLFNQIGGTSYTLDDVIVMPEFIRFVSALMMKVANRLQKMSRLFNIGGKGRFTPTEDLKILIHSELSANAKVYLYGDTFHEEFVKLPKADELPYWQGTGTDYDIANTTEVKVTTAEGHSCDVKGVLAVMFDRTMLGVTNYERYVESAPYNAKGSFWNMYYKQDSGYFNDFNENFVVFFAE